MTVYGIVETMYIRGQMVNSVVEIKENNNERIYRRSWFNFG